MELSPRLLTDIEFREQWRGYSPSEVDEFLERVAVGVGELQQRLAEALERASDAERKLLERTDEDEIRRTLVLAQRTAVQAMEEARADADRLVNDADERSRQLLADAQAQAAQLEAEIDGRRRDELGALAEQRAVLEGDIDRLQAYLDAQRDRLRTMLREQLDRLDEGLTLEPRPPVSDVDVPSPPAAPQPPPEVDIAPAAAPPSSGSTGAATGEPEPDAVDELRQAREELADALRRAGIADVDVPAEPTPAPHDRGSRPLLFDDRAPEPTAAHDIAADDEPAPAPRWREDAVDDDPFLAELRRAVVDTEPLGPRDDDHGAPEHLADDDLDGDAASGGLFRRGRRRG